MHEMSLNMYSCFRWASQVVLEVKKPPANAGDLRYAGSIPGWGRTPRGGHGDLLHHPQLENPRDTGEPGRLWSIGSQRVGHD